MKTRMTLAAVLVAISATAASTMAGPAQADGWYGRYPVWGAIEQAYVASGGPAQWGNPTMYEGPARNGGRYQKFEKDTSFYWHPSVDVGRAHQVGGAIRAKWAALRWENGPLGYPITNEEGRPRSRTPGTRTNYFVGGMIFWSPTTGAHPVWGEISNIWLRAGGTRSKYGLPTTDEYRTYGGGFGQNFQYGTIIWP